MDSWTPVTLGRDRVPRERRIGKQKSSPNLQALKRCVKFIHVKQMSIPSREQVTYHT